MNSPGSVISSIPIPGADVLGSVINFLAGLVKGKTQHATFEQVSPSSNTWAASVETSFADYSQAEQLMISRLGRDLLLQAMQEEWGMGGQGQPALANSISGHVPSIRELAATLYTWIAMNIDSEQPETFRTFMSWGWSYVFITALQQANISETRIKAAGTGSGSGSGTGTGAGKVFGIDVSWLAIGAALLVVFLLVKRKG